MPDDKNKSRIVIDTPGITDSTKYNPFSAPMEARRPSVPISPDWLLNHQNHFDPNTYTPEDMIKRGYNTQNRPEVKKA